MTDKNSPEKMNDFFNKRAGGYDKHMKETIPQFTAFYRKIVSPIQKTKEKIQILDLGIGTGLELEGIFKKATNAFVTGIDVSENMLKLLSYWIPHQHREPSY